MGKLERALFFCLVGIAARPLEAEDLAHKVTDEKLEIPGATESGCTPPTSVKLPAFKSCLDSQIEIALNKGSGVDNDYNSLIQHLSKACIDPEATKNPAAVLPLLSLTMAHLSATMWEEISRSRNGAIRGDPLSDRDKALQHLLTSSGTDQDKEGAAIFDDGFRNSWKAAGAMLQAPPLNLQFGKNGTIDFSHFPKDKASIAGILANEKVSESLNLLVGPDQIANLKALYGLTPKPKGGFHAAVLGNMVVIPNLPNNGMGTPNPTFETFDEYTKNISDTYASFKKDLKDLKKASAKASSFGNAAMTFVEGVQHTVGEYNPVLAPSLYIQDWITGYKNGDTKETQNSDHAMAEEKYVSELRNLQFKYGADNSVQQAFLQKARRSMETIAGNDDRFIDNFDTVFGAYELPLIAVGGATLAVAAAPALGVAGATVGTVGIGSVATTGAVIGGMAYAFNQVFNAGSSAISARVGQNHGEGDYFCLLAKESWQKYKDANKLTWGSGIGSFISGALAGAGVSILGKLRKVYQASYALSPVAAGVAANVTLGGAGAGLGATLGLFSLHAADTLDAQAKSIEASDPVRAKAMHTQSAKMYADYFFNVISGGILTAVFAKAGVSDLALNPSDINLAMAKKIFGIGKSYSPADVQAGLKQALTERMPQWEGLPPQTLYNNFRILRIAQDLLINNLRAGNEKNGYLLAAPSF